MTKRSTHEINFNSGQDRKRKIAVSKKGLLIIRCICGSEILIVPDLKAMNTAVKTHVAEHRQAQIVSDRLDWLEQFLTEQVLIVASEINLPNVNQ